MIERVVRDGTVVARSDGSVHAVFPVAVSPAEGEALRAWVVRERATRTIEVGLGVARAASFCLTNLGWTLEEASPADELHQWAVLRTSRDPDTRPFDYYVDF